MFISSLDYTLKSPVLLWVFLYKAEKPVIICRFIWQENNQKTLLSKYYIYNGVHYKSIVCCVLSIDAQKISAFPHNTFPETWFENPWDSVFVVFIATYLFYVYLPKTDHNEEYILIISRNRYYRIKQQMYLTSPETRPYTFSWCSCSWIDGYFNKMTSQTSKSTHGQTK